MNKSEKTALVGICLAALSEADMLMASPDIQEAFLGETAQLNRPTIRKSDISAAFEALCVLISRATNTVLAFQRNLSCDGIAAILGWEFPDYDPQVLAGCLQWAELRIKAGQIGVVRHVKLMPPVADTELVAIAFKLLREDRVLYSLHRLEHLRGLFSKMFPDVTTSEVAHVLAAIKHAMDVAYTLAEQYRYDGTISESEAITTLQANCPAIDEHTAGEIFGESVFLSR